ncbi:MAG: hypothetical protein QF441_16375 [Bacteriovoracaceae bacterium]|jgi:hypothetical protein|nr:hypothetical protein [Halobacteriovoraceae bacterium]MDP7322181.1 hypothetical protein [Bacteriovoracaceae bacterium]|tara:strand:+ start:1614 stop:1907 length:294 start_codon:yes stop_codon:yes gene_type:complete
METNTQFNQFNWNTAQYISEKYKAIIGLAASPQTANELIYVVTVIDQNHNEVFTKDFNTLELACTYINNKYADLWEFKDLSVAPANSEGGCSTCVAH